MESKSEPTSWEEKPITPMIEPLPIQDQRPFNPPLRFLSPQFYTMSRPQYKRSCGISSLVSIYNMLFSRLGRGTSQPITVERCLVELGITKELQEVGEDQQQDQNYPTNNVIVNKLDFGKFTGNTTLLTWFKLLCKKFGQKGRSTILYYPSSKKKGFCKNAEEARREIILGLLEGKGFIYHCHDHYMSPIGFYLNPDEEHCYTPPKKSPPQVDLPEVPAQQQISQQKLPKQPCPEDQPEQLIVEEVKVKPEVPSFDRATVFLVGEPSKKFAPFHELSWSEMDHDMRTPWYNVRRKDRGVTDKRGYKLGSTNKCIMMFEALEVNKEDQQS